MSTSPKIKTRCRPTSNAASASASAALLTSSLDDKEDGDVDRQVDQDQENEAVVGLGGGRLRPRRQLKEQWVTKPANKMAPRDNTKKKAVVKVSDAFVMSPKVMADTDDEEKPSALSSKVTMTPPKRKKKQRFDLVELMKPNSSKIDQEEDVFTPPELKSSPDLFESSQEKKLLSSPSSDPLASSSPPPSLSSQTPSKKRKKLANGTEAEADKDRPKKKKRKNREQVSVTSEEEEASTVPLPPPKQKASGAFDVEEMLSSELQDMKSDASQLAVGKTATKLLLARHRRMVKNLQSKTAASKAKRTPKGTERRGRPPMPKGQRAITAYLSPSPSSASSSSQECEHPAAPANFNIFNALTSTDDEDDDDVFNVSSAEDKEEDKVYQRLVLTIDQIEATQDVSEEYDCLDSYLLALKEMKEEDERREREEEEQKEQRVKMEERREKFRRENWRMKEVMDEDLDESRTREMLRAIVAHLRDVWAGRVAESSRYRAFKAGGHSRSALLYTMITHPFTDAQIEWIMEEIAIEWMPTERSRFDMQEFVWAVLLPEALIKIYMDFHKVERSEAEKRIANTPKEKPG